MTNNYATHHCCGVVLQERKNYNEQRNSSLFLCGLTCMKKYYEQLNCSLSSWCGFAGVKK
jgi:hypothetical protein